VPDEATPAELLAFRWWTRLRRSFGLPDLMTDEHAGRVNVGLLLRGHPSPVQGPSADPTFVTVSSSPFSMPCAHGEADPLLLPEDAQHLLDDFYDPTEVNRFELSVLAEAGPRQAPEPGLNQAAVLGMIGAMTRRAVESVKNRPLRNSRRCLLRLGPGSSTFLLRRGWTTYPASADLRCQEQRLRSPNETFQSPNFELELFCRRRSA
jgi:hypothetical protein